MTPRDELIFVLKSLLLEIRGISDQMLPGSDSSPQVYSMLIKELEIKKEKVNALKSAIKALPKPNDAIHREQRQQLQIDIESFQRSLNEINKSFHNAFTDGERNRYDNLKMQVSLKLDHVKLLYELV